MKQVFERDCDGKELLGNNFTRATTSLMTMAGCLVKTPVVAGLWLQGSSHTLVTVHTVSISSIG